jgi:opine dehydrogenase
MTSPVAVVGAGAGGLAMAADLALAGRSVRLIELPEFGENVNAVRSNGGIDIFGAGRTGHAVPDVVTVDAAAGVEGAELVLISVPAFGHARVVDALAPHVRSGQIVLFNTGYWAALRFAGRLNDRGRRSVVVAESSLLVYAARKIGPASVYVDGIKQDFPLAAVPTEQTNHVVDLVGQFYPQARAMRNVIEVSLENLNPMLHPAITLLSLSALEVAVGPFAFYRDGCTPAAGRIIDALDVERRSIGAALGLTDLVAVPEWLHRYYGASGDTTYEAIHSCPAYAEFVWPAATALRYVDEDVPFALVPLMSFGDELGIDVPVTRGLIRLCGIALGRDYLAVGPRATDLGLRGADASTLMSLAQGATS